MMKKKNPLLCILITVALLTGLCPIPSHAATEISVTIPSGETAFSVDLSVTEATPYAGIEFGLTLSSETELSFVSFERGSALTNSSASPFMTTRATHYFGFYSTVNQFQGTTKTGMLNFNYTGDKEQTITLTHMMIVRMSGANIPTGSKRSSPVFTIRVKRAASSDGTNSGGTGGSAGGTGGTPIVIDIGGDEIPLGDVTINSKYFDDVGYNLHWAIPSIDALFEKGVVKGVGTRLYGPTLPISRGDFMVMLVRAFNLTAETEENFSDVPEGVYFEESIAIAKALGIAKGNGTHFFPRDPITRQDMMVLVDRTLTAVGRPIKQSGNTILSSFADSSGISDYAQEAVMRLVDSGIIKGDGMRINPLGNTTRAEMAVVIDRLLALE